MRRPGLFLRIFVWFWVCMTVVAAGNVFVVVLNRPQEFLIEHRDRSARMLRLLAGREAGTAGPSQDWLGRVRDELHMEIFVYDHEGRPLGADTASPEARQALGRVLAGSETADVEVPGGYWLAVSVKPVGGGERVAVAMIRIHRPPLLAFLGPGPVGWRLVLVFLLSGGLCLLLAGSIASPLRTLRTAAQRLAAGNLEARVPPGLRGRGDEIGVLAEDFNVMAERLDEAMASQKRLLTDISHELRSPLARLTVALELARSRPGDEGRRALDRIEKEAGRIEELIGQLLALSRLEAGEGQRNLVRVDLTGLVQDVVRDADFEARSRGRSVRLAESVPAWVAGNGELLTRAVENVVRNAVRHAPEGTTVDVSLGREDTAVRIAVRDRGLGVPEEALERIFRPFYRVAEARERGTGGSGLGLAISQRAVRMHGGSINARNHPDGGLLVDITLPAVSDA